MSTRFVALQFLLEPLWRKYFQEREIPVERLARAARHATEEERQAVDAVVRAIARKGTHVGLSEREADLLALRLDYAWRWVAVRVERHDWSIDEEEAVERLLNEYWHASGHALQLSHFAKVNIGGCI